MKTAWVLRGGASFGAAQVGMARALLEAGHHPDLLYGTSAGALNAAWLAADPTLPGLDRLAELWTRARRRDVFPIDPWVALSGVPELYGKSRRPGRVAAGHVPFAAVAGRRATSCGSGDRHPEWRRGPARFGPGRTCLAGHVGHARGLPTRERRRPLVSRRQHLVRHSRCRGRRGWLDPDLGFTKCPRRALEPPPKGSRRSANGYLDHGFEAARRRSQQLEQSLRALCPPHAVGPGHFRVQLPSEPRTHDRGVPDCGRLAYPRATRDQTLARRGRAALTSCDVGDHSCTLVTKLRKTR
jgi:hypothetical protein